MPMLKKRANRQVVKKTPPEEAEFRNNKKLYDKLSYHFHVYCLGAFFALFDFEFDLLVLLKSPETLFVDARVMNEDVIVSFG